MTATAPTGDQDRITDSAAPLRIERLVNELAAGDLDVDTFMERLDAMVASPPLDREKIDRARRRWRAIL